MTNELSQNDGSTLVPKALIAAIRRFIQDYPQVNTLVEGEETDDVTMGRYLLDTLDEWNYTPPILNQFLITPMELAVRPEYGAARRAILDKTAARIMQSIVNRLARADMPYTAGNVTIQPEAVWRNLQPIVQDLSIQFNEARTRIKMGWNDLGAFGASYSDLALPFLIGDAEMVRVPL